VARTCILRKNIPYHFVALFIIADKFRNLATFQSYYQPLINALRNPSTLKNLFPSPQSVLARVRNMNKQELVFVGVTAAEVIGFFTVGEIIGRRHIVGYRGEPEHAHHH
jgi:F-type H+-transporting ATPase subunit g